MGKNKQCLLCGSSRFRLIHRKDQWKYLRCIACGLVTMVPHPRPEDLIASYDTYLPEDPEAIKKWQRMMTPIVLTSARLIESAWDKPPGRLLDIGSGYGFFLKEMKRRGWDVAGIELSKTGRNYTENKANIPVYSRPLESLCLPQGHFDVVTLFYVIEHLSDPVTTIREVYRILGPGGIILLRWPHSSPIVRLLGPLSGKFDLYHTPFHLYDFSPGTIDCLLAAVSFEGIQTVVGGHTLPDIRVNRWAAVTTGVLAEIVYRFSRERVLLPGISKTTMARKPVGHCLNENTA